MPARSLIYQGINRAVTDYNSSGACEEMINLRPTGTGLAPVRSFTINVENSQYDCIFVHESSLGTNYIAIKINGYSIDIYRVSETGEVIGSKVGSLDITGASHISTDDINFAYTGNVFMISVCDREDEFFGAKEYMYDGAQYVEKALSIPSVSATFLVSNTIRGSYSVATNTAMSDAQLKELLSDSINKNESEDEYFCAGPVIVAVAYKTKGGDTICTNQFLFYDPTEAIQENTRNYYDSGRNAYHSIFENREPGTEEITSYSTWVGGIHLSLSLSVLSSWDDEKSIIDSVEIYCSRPSPIIDPYYKSLIEYGSGMNHSWYAYGKPASEMDLGDELLFLQKSIPVKEIINAPYNSYEFLLKFGGNVQTTSTTLEADAGETYRYGKMYAFNSRYHFFDSVTKTKIMMPNYRYYNSTASLVTRYCFVVFNDGMKDNTIFLGGSDTYKETGLQYIISSSSRIKKVILYERGVLSSVAHIFVMSPSNRYNYSINYGNEDETETLSPSSNIYETLIGEGAKSSIIIDESTAINVSEQYDPFVFLPLHSYAAPGKVVDIKQQMVAVRDVSYGDYPLNVFTNRGVYALLQGSGTVLYGAFRSVSNLISSSNSVSTEMGTFFLAAGSMWCISGSSTVLVSDALSMGPHKYIRDCSGYTSLSGMSGMSMQPYESIVPFDIFSQGARLAYNRKRDEIIVSHPSYDYSYVLSLKYRQWFKLSVPVRQDSVGSNIATTVPSSFDGETDAISLMNGYGGMFTAIIHVPGVRNYNYGIGFASITDKDALFEELTETWQEECEWTEMENVSFSYHNTGDGDNQIKVAATGIPYHPGITAEFRYTVLSDPTTVIYEVEKPFSFTERMNVVDLWEEEDEVRTPLTMEGETEYDRLSVSGGNYIIGASIDLGYRGTFTCSLRFTGSQMSSWDDIMDALNAKWQEDHGNDIASGVTFDYRSVTVSSVTKTRFLVDGIPYARTCTASISFGVFGGTIKTYDFLLSVATWQEGVKAQQLVHLQTRPFTFDYMYAHIHRIVSMTRADMPSGKTIIVALYGSDNLQDWSLLTYADRSNAKFSQIRTAPAARSWRYYTIVVTGDVPVDTDFGPFLVDYKMVDRRIG